MMPDMKPGRDETEPARAAPGDNRRPRIWADLSLRTKLLLLVVGLVTLPGVVFALIAFSGTRAALDAIREGALTATLNTNPREMGRILMRTVVRGLNRRESVESEIFSPINIVDLGNVVHY